MDLKCGKKAKKVQGSVTTDFPKVNHIARGRE